VSERLGYITQIEEAPAELRTAVSGLSGEQLDTPYRPGGWTVRQLVHHVPESHMNCYVRFKLALTERAPTIKPYDEKRWAETPEVAATPVETSLMLLEYLHQRWVLLLRGMSAEDWRRTFVHPERDAPVTLDQALALYAWHGRHHVAHVAGLRRRMGW
jgi:uncharacterized damage-inducible protein DinB